MAHWVKKTPGFVGRFALLLLMLIIVLLVMFVSFLTGQIAEITVPMVLQELLPEFLSKSFLSTPEFSDWIVLLPVVLALPVFLAWILWREAFHTLKNSLKNAGQQALDFLRGREKQSVRGTLWALLQVNPALIAILVPLGAFPIPWLDEIVMTPVSSLVEPRTVVRKELVFATDRIYFGKARLSPEETFTPQGTSVPESAKRMLQRAVCALKLSRESCASVVVHGFASDEEFWNPPGSRSDLKNLQLADHRAQAVSNILSDLPEVRKNWLTVKVPNRWTPAINEKEQICNSWTAMQNKRACLVKQTKNRDAQLDRVVVLEWKLNQPCNDSAEAVSGED